MITAGLNVSHQSVGQFRLGGQPSTNQLARKRMTYRVGLPRSPTSSACVRTAFLLLHDHTLHSQWLLSRAHLCCDRLSPPGRPSSRRMSASRRSSLSMPPLRSRSCLHCLVSRDPAISRTKILPMERSIWTCLEAVTNVLFAVQSLFREPVCDFRAFPIPTLPTHFDGIEHKTACNLWRYSVSVIFGAQTMSTVESQIPPFPEIFGISLSR